jgi:O-antigen ligase
MALSFPFCFTFMMLAKNPIRKSFWAFLMLAMAYCVLLTASRGGLLGLLIGAGGCVWGFGIKQRRVLLVLFALMASLIMLPFAGNLALKRMVGTFDRSQSVAAAYESAQARQELLGKSIRVSLDHPIFGVGPGDFQIISGWHETHDVYTQLSAECGIPALIIFLMILYRAFHNTWMIRQSTSGRSEIAMIATALRTDLVVFAITSFFYPVAYHFFVYFLFAYITAAYRVVASSGHTAADSQDRRHHPGAVRIAELFSQAKPKGVWTA